MEDREGIAERAGRRLRDVRRARGLSLERLASLAGVGKGSLSEIENGRRSPNLSTLYALAGALDLPLADLLADEVGARVASPGIDAHLLEVRRHPDATTEVYRLDLSPDAPHVSPAHGPGVVEHLLVTAGRVRAGRVGEEVDLATGEATDWHSDVAHGYHALDGAPAEAVVVIRSPGGVPVGDGV